MNTRLMPCDRECRGSLLIERKHCSFHGRAADAI